MTVLIAYTVQIEASADGAIWRAVAPAETALAETATAADVARYVADNQTAADGDLWRVRVWNGDDADTGTTPAAEYVHDIRDQAAAEREQDARDRYWTEGCGADVLATDDRLREADQTAPTVDADGNPTTVAGAIVSYFAERARTGRA